jgi:hypothetical protein
VLPMHLSLHALRVSSSLTLSSVASQLLPPKLMTLSCPLSAHTTLLKRDDTRISPS